MLKFEQVTGDGFPIISNARDQAHPGDPNFFHIVYWVIGRLVFGKAKGLLA
jgi:hypothetical protein